MTPDWFDDFRGFEDFADLIRNIEDPEQIVRIASLRALVRVAATLEPGLRERLFDRVMSKVHPAEELHVLGVNFLPQSRLLKRVSKILASSDEEDRARARNLLESIVRQARSEIESAHESRAAVKAFNTIVSHHYDFGTRQKRPRLPKKFSPRVASYVITLEFANLAMLDFDDRTETHLAESEYIGQQIQSLGTAFKPDIPALFQVYQAFFRHSMQFWLYWLDDRRKYGLDPVREMPEWFPIAEGPLAVTRQIEWAVSRDNLVDLVSGLSNELESSEPRDRWAAANLIEWSARYHFQPVAPRFGGGAGPEDLLEFDYDPGTGTGGHLPTRSTREGAETSELKPVEPQRYTDLTIFNEELYPGDDSSASTSVDETTPLVPNSPYTLEVAIRLKRTGISSKFEPTRGVKNPRKDQETLSIYIVADSLLPSIGVKEPFTKVTWPYNSDSEPAYFRLEVKQAATPKGIIEVRIYDGSLDLLDIVQLTVSIASPGLADVARLPPAKVEWIDNSEGLLNVAADNPPRLLSIDVGVDPESSRYRFLFKFLANNQKVFIPGSCLITSDDIDALLVKVRDFWTELVITNYSNDLSVTRTTFGKYLNQLKDLGIQAWSLLFGARYGPMAGASETIGDLLKSLRPNEGARIQITYSNAENFIFPWSIVHPPDEDASVSPFEFWGARYQIEQVIGGPKHDDLMDIPINVVFTLDPGFANSQSQKQLLKDYQTASNGRLRVSDPISGIDAFLQALVQAPAAHVYYFYCHGYAPSAKNIFKRDGVQLMKKQIEALPEGSPERAALETLLRLTAKMNDEPWIYIGNSEVKESRIKLQPFFNKKRPIVFLNMCQSADLLPTLSSGLVRVFLDHSASAVVGTESPMTGVFANAFSKTFFDELFAGDDVGTALWKARRRFLQDDMRNPLGLAYTLYGRAVARVGNRPIIAKQAATVTEQPVLEKPEENGDKS